MPMIEVDRLTKRFATTLAVDDVSFVAREGEILGVLGPNGAGKTTTLRTICGYLEPTSGRVLVGGLDAAREPIAVRRRIGFLPENNPLYPEMRVAEYLSFRAAIKGVPRAERPARLERAAQRCGIGDVLERIIGRLSRGYRQRVGLADALLADPPVLVLDEPTVGLDPNQVRQVRSLIRELREGHTVLVSSHILGEVEQVCDRVVIFHRGRVVAEDATDSLRAHLASGTAALLELSPDHAGRLEELVSGLATVRNTERLEDGWLRAELQSEADPREAIFRRAAELGIVLRELSRRRVSLEDVFHQLTAGEQEPAAARAGEEAS